MSDLHKRLCDQVESLREDGHEPDKVIVPAEKWGGVKSSAKVIEGEGFMGGDKTLVNGVEASYLDPLGDARVVIEVSKEEE